MSTPPPRRRRRRPQHSDEAELQAPRRRRKSSGSSGKKKKSSKQNKLLLQIALFAGAAIVLLGGIFMMDWREVGKALGLPSAQERMQNRLLAMKAEQADLLASIRDEASARAASQAMSDLAVESIEMMQEVRDLGKDKSQRLSREEERELTARFKEQNKEIDARIKQEMARIRKDPQLSRIMAEIQRDIQFEMIEARSEMQKKSLAAGASAEGFSPVTSWTSLSPGDEVEALYMNVHWRPGKVVEVAGDGKVKVHLDIHGGTNSFDQFYKRGQLRIRD